MPEHISKFYERIEDVEEKSGIVVERNPRLKLNWGQHVLDEETLKRVALAFGLAPGPAEQAKHEPFSRYLAGLAYLGKNDIHLRLEADAFFEFYMAFKTAAKVYEDWDGLGTFSDTAKKIFERVVPGAESCQEYILLGESMEAQQKSSQEITLTEACGMKIYCDAYLYSILSEMAQKRVAEETPTSQTNNRDQG